LAALAARDRAIRLEPLRVFTLGWRYVIARDEYGMAYVGVGSPRASSLRRIGSRTA